MELSTQFHISGFQGWGGIICQGGYRGHILGMGRVSVLSSEVLIPVSPDTRFLLGLNLTTRQMIIQKKNINSHSRDGSSVRGIFWSADICITWYPNPIHLLGLGSKIQKYQMPRRRYDGWGHCWGVMNSAQHPRLPPCSVADLQHLVLTLPHLVLSERIDIEIFPSKDAEQSIQLEVCYKRSDMELKKEKREKKGKKVHDGGPSRPVVRRCAIKCILNKRS